jgi:hypothetical protein
MRNCALRGCLILLPLLVSATTLAKSNDPTPGPSEIGNPEPSKPGEPATPAHKNQDRTAIPPLIVKETPAPKAQKESAENTKEADNKTSTDWWMVWLTGILAFVAFLQLIVFGLHGRRLRQTIDKIKELGKRLRGARDSCEPTTLNIEASSQVMTKRRIRGLKLENRPVAAILSRGAALSH